MLRIPTINNINDGKKYIIVQMKNKKNILLELK